MKEFITIDHLDVMAKLVLATSLLTSYGYLSEQFLSWYAGEHVEHYTYLNRLIGLGTVRRDHVDAVHLQHDRAANPLDQAAAAQGGRAAAVVSIARARGHVAGALHDYLHHAAPRLPAVVVGHLQADDLGHRNVLRSMGMFLVAFLLFARFLPILSMSETRAMLPGAHGPEVGR